jgi:ABC-2 type transport system ATP-binding protein
MKNTDAVVSVRDLSRSFGGKLPALDHVSLEVPSGSVVGIVGENGAGKTTLIKHILGLLRAEQGSVTVFGHDPAADPVPVLSRIGYLSEEPDMPEWMRVHELLRYVAAFYPSWDPAFADRLLREFGLDPRKKLHELSKGQRARAGLLTALAYRPELLVLDEPSSGLDPVVRRDILAAIIRTIAEEGRTVIFSSHLLSEVERVSDRVAMIEAGRVVFCDSLDNIKESHARLTLRFDAARSAPPAVAGALRWDGAGREWTVVCSGDSDGWTQTMAGVGGTIVERTALSLDEIFLAHAAGRTKAAHVEDVGA